MRSAIFDGGNFNNPANVMMTAEIPRFSSDINNYILVGGVARSISVPVGAEFVFMNAVSSSGVSNMTYFTCDGAIGTASIPVADITDGSGVEVNASVRNVRLTTSISVIAPQAGIFMCAFYARADNTATS
jgi:hypothetical protein